MADRNQNMFVKKLQAVVPSMLCLGGIKEATGKGGPPLQCWIHGANSFSAANLLQAIVSKPVYYCDNEHKDMIQLLQKVQGWQTMKNPSKSSSSGRFGIVISTVNLCFE
ncbi:hypothetical protein Tco_0807819, partial [Tanacetum coccineum]